MSFSFFNIRLRGDTENIKKTNEQKRSDLKYFLFVLQVSQDVTEIEELRRRLERAETELKMVLESGQCQKEVEELMEGGSGQNDRGDEVTVQSVQRTGRKSSRS